MGVSSREKGLLKLVHPGRHVEIHRKPVIAAELMSKYPRHCIARPDVFRFPWIVVRPESVLLPGKVFYLVPYHTMYNLLKGKGPLGQTSEDNKSIMYHYRHHGYSPNQRNAPGKKRQYRHHQNDCCQGCRPLRALVQLRTNKDSDDDIWSDTSYADAWTEINRTARQLNIHSDQSGSSSHDPLLNKHRSFPAEGLQHYSSSFSSTILGNASIYTKISGDNTELRSAFRKQDSVRKMLNLKVTFGSQILIPYHSR